MLKTILTFIHLASFAVSFGLVLYSDFIMMTVPIKGTVTHKQLDYLKSASAFILGALVILILSGVSFLGYYYLFNPEALSNPKLYVKMLVVMILTINGLWMHKKGIQILQNNLNKNLHLDLKNFKKLLTSGGLSALSWWTAFILGTFQQLNFSFSFLSLISVYILMVIFTLISVEIYLKILNINKKMYLEWTR